MDSKNKIRPNTFPKAEKLKSSKAIDGLFKSGKSFFIHPYKVFYVLTDSSLQSEVGSGQSAINNQQLNPTDNQPSTNNQPPTANSQLLSIQSGFAVSAKNFKHAVDRNRVKRLGREAYRLNKHQLTSHLESQHLQLQVFFVFTNKSLPTFVQVQSAMQACLRKLIKNAKKDEGLLQG